MRALIYNDYLIKERCEVLSILLPNTICDKPLWIGG